MTKEEVEKGGIYFKPFEIFKKCFYSENIDLFDQMLVTFDLSKEEASKLISELMYDKFYYVFLEGVIFNIKPILTRNNLLDACLSKLILLNLNLKEDSIGKIAFALNNYYHSNYTYSTIYKALYYGLGINRDNLHLM